MELPQRSSQQDTLLTLKALHPPPPEKNPSVLQAECVGACPALPATEMSVWTVLCLLAFSYTHIKGAVYKEAKGMS